MHIISLRWKEVKVIGLFVIVYTFIISFHLLRLIDDTGTRELELLRMKSVELNNKGQTVLAVRTENAEHAEEKPMRNDILAKVLLNQVPDLSLQKKKQKPIRAGVRQLEAKNLKSIVHGDAAYDNTYNDDSAQVTPPGFMGAPVIIDPEKLSPEEKELYDKGWSDNTFNQFVSDRIPLSRDLPDLRHPLCRSQTYSWSLPRMSVIICFHNEAWSTLLRTVHSVLKTTHPRLLEEIILVDDASTMVHLKKDLDTHVAKLPKVKVIRSPKREGLVRARLMGTEVAKAEVLTFLDSHCECVMGWAEPQLARVHHDPTVVVWPVIPSIDHSTFEFKHKPEDLVSAKGGFYWDMNFRWEPITEHDNVDRQDITSPVRSPTMAGGLFMINKQFFEHLGTYDPQFELWGGENMELSFKADVGDISQRQDLRRDLKCQSFDWYIKNIYPEVFLPSEALQRGTIQSAGVEAFCLDAMEKRAHKKAVQLTQCRKKGMCQAWYLTKLGELRSGYNCLDVGLDPTYATIKMTGCHGQRGNQYWQYRMDRTLYHKGVDGCIAVDPQTKQVSLLVCNNSRAQQWLWVSFNS
ncbi:putative polypeptide N-acetylgalactosaminyltransferase 9 isoform X2 [Haliotis rufescens]|uniref:putative polypeptide N-acetylgalactosaminyltransferase 9 isoform X2 n=1 Tax=Haliotis rufescens TaxID=6454 RepID=UPI00201FB1AA|nr:putative polypeptide N-acetylgalactosaminyltransferase 9 isoform X2 [Haliotis rufescens]